MDRERVLRTVLRGNGVLGNDYPSMSGSPYSNPHLEQRRLDPDKAKFHLAKSGIGKSPVPVHVSEASAFSVEIGQILLRQAARSEEHTSELPSLMRISYAAFCLNKKNK